MLDAKTSLDHYFAQFLALRTTLTGSAKERFKDIVERLSASLDGGHSCLQLTLKEKDLLSQILGTDILSRAEERRNSALILRGDYLYLQRYYRYETRLARQLKTLAGTRITQCFNRDDLLARLFPEDQETGERDYQKEAAELALQRLLIIISGGPGTGKTTTIVKILLLLIETSADSLKIGLAAPTGKAAMRLSESIGNSLKALTVESEILSTIPTAAQTLHRLLGTRRYSTKFHHTSENPMEYDLVVVDEASMVDLAMMSKLVDALKPGARLILLGDKDQLASVESGAVLGDLIQSLPENSIELKKTFRFDKDIGDLARAINRAEPTLVWKYLAGSSDSNVSLLSDTFYDYIGGKYEEYMDFVSKNSNQNIEDIHTVFSEFGKFQVLCALHRGRRGVERINSRVEYYLASKGYSCRSNSWYHGRPVLITRNDYTLNLFNGDIGICLKDEETGSTKVWFERPDGTLKSFFPNRLPERETVFAMTIHKSQGSEFDEVVVVLPAAENRILSRELLYTGITRARKVVRVAAARDVLKLTVGSTNERTSGLSALLE